MIEADIRSDHPRMRGEDRTLRVPSARHMGSPPHARGRPSTRATARSSQRITPACAGKTGASGEMEGLGEDHPRMRGEDAVGAYDQEAGAGSPPHARGRRMRRTGKENRTRITPACAGKTFGGGVLGLVWGDHPRMRGEDSAV